MLYGQNEYIVTTYLILGFKKKNVDKDNGCSKFKNITRFLPRKRIWFVNNNK